MTIARILAFASLALAAGGAASSLALAAPAVHGAVNLAAAGRGLAPAAGASPRGGARPGFQAGPGDWGYGRHATPREQRFGGWRGNDQRRFHAYELGYPYGYGGFYDDYQGYGPAAFGPEPPYGESFAPGYRPHRPPVARQTAAALAPLAYGRGVHDGAYAYGYNGYAETPSLDIAYGAAGWPGVMVGRSCGC
jgi:hypothetical protein